MKNAIQFLDDSSRWNSQVFGPVEIEFLGTTKSIPGTIKSLATIAIRRLKECNSKTIQGLFWTIAFRVTIAVHLLERWLCIP